MYKSHETLPLSILTHNDDGYNQYFYLTNRRFNMDDIIEFEYKYESWKYIKVNGVIDSCVRFFYVDNGLHDKAISEFNDLVRTSKYES